MGDWQNIMSMDGAYAPWDSAGWNDVEDRKRELYEEGYMSAAECKAAGRIIKTGAKGLFVPFVGHFFKEEDLDPITSPVDLASELRFETFEEALDWARDNRGRSITRSPDGCGFVSKA